MRLFVQTCTDQIIWSENLGMSNLTLMTCHMASYIKINKRLISIFVPVHDHFLVKKGGKIIVTHSL